MTALDAAAWAPDILGDGYDQRVIDLGDDPDGEGPVRAVLVRRETRSAEHVGGIVLYVHGFSDYFFQRELADFLAVRGFAFHDSTCASPAVPGRMATPLITSPTSLCTTLSSRPP